MQLEKRIIAHTLSAFGLLFAICMPILYLSDFLFSEEFMAIYALAKLPFRYGQTLGSLALWSTWIAVRTMRKEYSDTAFITIAFLPKHALRVLVFISICFMALDAFVIIPLSHVFFPEQVIKTNWSVKEISNNVGLGKTAFIHKLGDNVELWQVDEGVKSLEGSWQNSRAKFIQKHASCEIKCEIKMEEDDFFVLWNEPKKLSFGGLKRCEAYLKYHGLDTSDLQVQWHIFISRIALLLAMVLCGFALGWKNSMNGVIACCILASWILQLVIFMPAKIAIVCLWLNVLLWMVVGCVLL